MAELAFDVLEEILVRGDVKDLIRCKSVCKSWRSFISSPRFVEAHLKHSCNNDLDNHEFGHRRIGMGISMDEDDLLGYNVGNMSTDEDSWLECDRLHVVGSSNGLVCVSPKNLEFVVTNPSTREQKKLPTLPHPSDVAKFPYPSVVAKFGIRLAACWGFGYDSSTDDYKVIAGFRKKKRMLFYVLTLKSNIWKFLGRVKYIFAEGVSGILCGGALYWFLSGENKKVILSVDLSTHEFKEIPQPVDEQYRSSAVDDYKLGVIEECLCIFWDRSCFSTKKWVMKNNKWEVYNNDLCKNRYDLAHGITTSRSGPMTYIYGVNDGERVPSIGSYIRASIFVKSLVSPHLHVTNDEGRKRKAKAQQQQQGKEEGNIRKRRKKFCKRKKPLVLFKGLVGKKPF